MNTSISEMHDGDDSVLKPAMGIGAAPDGIGARLFCIGFALFEAPSNILLQKVRARIWLYGLVATSLIAAIIVFAARNTPKIAPAVAQCKPTPNPA